MKNLTSLLLLIALTSLSHLSYAKAPQWAQNTSANAITFAVAKTAEPSVERIPGVIQLTPLPRRQPGWANATDTFAPAYEGKSTYVRTLGHTYKRRTPGQLRTRLASNYGYAATATRVPNQYLAQNTKVRRYTRVFRQTLGHKFYQPQLIAGQL